MDMIDDGVGQAIESVEKVKILHRSFSETRSRLSAACRTIFCGEVIVLIGPSRVGKTRCIRDALGVPSLNVPDDEGVLRTVVVDAGNDSKGGEFSTKGFMAECLRAIHHPIYGIADAADPWGERLHARLYRTSEATLRGAIETAIERRGTEYFVIDEAHHVRYAPGGDAAAARILDSYKCLANRTRIKLILAGSYQLLSLLTLAPHLIGRQQSLEFARYRIESERAVMAWEQVLRHYSKAISFESGQSLSTWNRYLFEGSLGCVGGLSRWLRASLVAMQIEGSSNLNQRVLERCRLPLVQESALLAEIVEGERMMLRMNEGERRSTVIASSTAAGNSNSSNEGANKSMRKPFQRASRRNRLGGRS